MKKMKKTLVLVLALTMVLASMSVTALAADPAVGSIIQFGDIGGGWGKYEWRVLDVDGGKALII
jgi:hypothetical protein